MAFPLRRTEGATEPGLSEQSRRASRGVRRAAEKYVSTGSRPVGLSVPPRRPPFPTSSLAFPVDRSPNLAIRVHSLVRFVLFGVPSSSSSPSGFPAARPVGGFFPLRDIIGGVHFGGPLGSSSQELPAPASLRPQVFSTSRRFSPLADFAGLFHPAATCRVSPFRGFSRFAALPARRRSLPPCRCRQHAHRLPGCHALAPRLRGLAPQIDAFSAGRCLAFLRVAPLFGFRPPSGPGARFGRPITRPFRSWRLSADSSRCLAAPRWISRSPSAYFRRAR